MNVGRPGCPVTSDTGPHGQGQPCEGEPTHTAVIRWKLRRRWVRVYPCTRHAAEIVGAEPMTDEHRAMLADRQEQVRRALAGLPWEPTPTSTDREQV